MAAELINPNPILHERKLTVRTKPTQRPEDLGIGGREPIDALEIFDHIRDINDPEHPYTLEQLNVVSEEMIDVDDARGRVSVQFTPTVAHCSMATLIGLSLRVKLLRSLPPRFKVDIKLSPGSHSSEAAVNKQLSDKERVAAALENPNLLAMVNKCLGAAATAMQPAGEAATAS
ncbi:Protein ae7 [Pleodorina starrii]|uniref:Protein ae7 n=1 Tax=Pleodorina starrii TaxID=330485 RepID=A0A9W6BYS8_9CHLO|nr:Protein ae7 [Pleodorina starrii]GLC60767.1 Protein ae7 [Pleodorina starrii]GLC75486.1 Protein ae7 [Pleodorina starrii]